MYINKKYEIIIKSICQVKGIDQEELINILKDSNCKYLLFLLMRKYKCGYTNKVKKELNINSYRTINKNLRKAKEKFLINKNFRDTYFEISSLIERNLQKSMEEIS